MDARTNSALRQNLKDVMREDGTLTINEVILLYRKASSDKHYKLLFLHATEEHNFTTDTAQHWMQIQKRKNFRCPQKNIVPLLHGPWCLHFCVAVGVLHATQNGTKAPTTATFISAKQTFEVCGYQHFGTANKNETRKQADYCNDWLLQ